MRTLLLWLAVLLFFSLYPFSQRGLVPHSDLLVHAVLYGITCLLLFSVLGGLSREALRRHALSLAVVSASAYGLLMEVAQSFTRTRTFSWEDEMANVGGALLAALYIIARRKRR
ncbi:MAG: VanZ family protein [Nitrospirota bacterium]